MPWANSRRFAPRHLWTGLVLALLLMLTAAQASADAFSRARLAPLIGSERLRLFTYGQALNTRTAPPALTRAMRQGLERSGFYHEGAPALIARDLRFTPVLAWDENINGGYFNDTFNLYGLSFQVDPANLARAGLVLGGRLGGEARLAWGPGRLLDFSASAEVGWSPRHDIGRGNAQLSACARNHLTGWTFADVCATAQAGRRSLSSSHSTAVSASLAHLFATGAAYHEVTVELERLHLAEGGQNTVSLGWNAVWNRATTGLSLTLGEPIPGQNATRARVSAQASWLWGSRPVTLSAWHMQASGGMLMGLPRQDRLTGIGLTLQPRPGLSVELMHQVTTSSIDLFAEARTGLSVRFQFDPRR